MRVPTVKDILLNALEGLCLRVDIAVEAGLEGADMPQYCLGLSQSLLGISDPSQSSSAYGAPCSSSLLHGHVPTDMGATQVQCPDCSSVFPDLRTLRVHQASHHKVTVATRNIGVPLMPFSMLVQECPYARFVTRCSPGGLCLGITFKRVGVPFLIRSLPCHCRPQW